MKSSSSSSQSSRSSSTSVSSTTSQKSSSISRSSLSSVPRTSSSSFRSSLIAGAYCGDKILQRDRGEQCDLGSDNGVPGKNCSVSCQLIEIVSCGNKIIENTEECDDGNRRDFDGCSGQCKLEVGTCGDGKIQSAYGEECDDGKSNGTKTSSCDEQCQKVIIKQFCGDGKLQKELGEECDLGAGNNDVGTTKCTLRCQLPICGDRILQNAEQCDDGNLFDYDGCDHTCVKEEGKDAAHNSSYSSLSYISLNSSLSTTSGQNVEDTSGTGEEESLLGGSLISGELLPDGTFVEDEGVTKATGGEGYTSNDDRSAFDRVPTPARTATGPGLVIFLASGAATGIGLVRRRILR